MSNHFEFIIARKSTRPNESALSNYNAVAFVTRMSVHIFFNILSRKYSKLSPRSLLSYTWCSFLLFFYCVAAEQGFKVCFTLLHSLSLTQNMQPWKEREKFIRISFTRVSNERYCLGKIKVSVSKVRAHGKSTFQSKSQSLDQWNC